MAGRRAHLHQPLLSRDLRFPGRDLQFAGHDLQSGLFEDQAVKQQARQSACRDLQFVACASPKPISQHFQWDFDDLLPAAIARDELGRLRDIPLPGLERFATLSQKKRRRGRASRRVEHPPDTLLDAYLRRLSAHGTAQKSFIAYRYQLRTTLRVATVLAGRLVTCAELFRDPMLLGKSLVHHRSLGNGQQLSRWTLDQRRAALRSFAKLMRPELSGLLDENPHAVLDEALRAVAEKVGTRYRLNGGTPRRRGGRTPTAREIGAVLNALGQAQGWLGLRNRVFFRILFETGARVNALRRLDGADCLELAGGHLRLFLHEKGKDEPREVELSRETSDELMTYAQGFNLSAAARQSTARICFGKSGPVWRSSYRGRWSYNGMRATLHSACAAVGVASFTPHALRRAFATDASSRLPRHIVELAGGWRGLERLEEHYVHPREAIIRRKLQQGGPPDRVALFDPNHDRTPALVL